MRLLPVHTIFNQDRVCHASLGFGIKSRAQIAASPASYLLREVLISGDDKNAVTIFLGSLSPKSSN